MTKVFLAFASGNDFHQTILTEAARDASSPDRVITPWSSKDPSGQPIDKAVESWIDEADAFVGDISVVNMNVTYEIGYAIGSEKPTRLVRSNHLSYAPVKSVGLLDTLAHDSYDFQPKLRQILLQADVTPSWNIKGRNREQPVFILQPPAANDVSRVTISAVKKVARLRYRSFNPAEISRLNASEAYEQTASSFGIIAFWLEGEGDTIVRNNQQAAFIYGVARGLGLPAYLIAHQSSPLPLDLHDNALRWQRLEHIDGLIGQFRDHVADELVRYTASEEAPPAGTLASISFGDPMAENEQTQLSHFFVATSAFAQALSGQANVLVGRKGSGKSATFFQVRDRTRANKQNIVVDLMPEGYQLIKLKEFILDRLSLGARKEVISAFWEYVIWLEIGYKILEKDQSKSKYDPDLLAKYNSLDNLFRKRVDTGIGDFSERLKLLTENVIARFSEKHTNTSDVSSLKSSEVLNIVYGEDLRELRNVVLEYLKIKGIVHFLFDNLDRIWMPGGFTAEDSVILIGLAEAMQEIARKFHKKEYEFRWTLFIRSDVYEFLVAGMADYGKLSMQSLEWSDRELLKALFNRRLVSDNGRIERAITLSEVSVTHVHGKPTIDFLIDSSMMRPRYLIRLFETARRRALALSKERIEEADYDFALGELGWQALEDLDREIADIVPDGQSLLFEFLGQPDRLTPDKLRYLAGIQIHDKQVIDKLIDVMIWNGTLGIKEGNTSRYIFDTGYRRQYIATKIARQGDCELTLHPTLRAAIT